jgi:nucleotide-binding universal stress UspA family protein
MRRQSYLLAVSGSEQSLRAIETGWNLARQTGASLKPLHVVNTSGIINLLSMTRPGLVGSGLDVAAYETMVKVLRESANILSDAYSAKFAQSEELQIAEGDPVGIIDAESANQDLVIVGHAPPHATEDSTVGQHASVAAGLADSCPSPLLIIQGQSTAWKAMRIVTTSEHINTRYLSQCIHLAQHLGLRAELLCLTTGQHEEPPLDFIRDLKTNHPDLADIKTEFHRIQNYPLDYDNSVWWPDEADIECGTADDTLLVLPTRGFGDHRLSVYANPPSYFIRHLALPAVLLYPEEYSVELDCCKEQLSAIATGKK